jgi:CheY-like chemotaxis protein
LGLYSLSKRMESLGGNCGVEGRSDGKTGSCFWISIPFKPDETEDFDLPIECRVSSNCSKSPIRAFSPSDSGITSFMSVTYDGNDKQEHSYSVAKHSGQHLRILLVDDSIMIRKATSRSLSREGYEVEVAQNGAECLKMLKSNKTAGCAFDVILMDLQMPVMDGLEATRRIRALEHTSQMISERNAAGLCPHIMIIGISANTAGEARFDCMESGMDGFIEKPLRIGSFQTYLSKIRLNLELEDIVEIGE